MRKRTIAITLAAASLAAVAPTAQGAPSQHRLKLTIMDSTITSQGDHSGNEQNTAGLVSGGALGKSVESISDKVTTVTSTTITLAGTITIYTTHGTLNGTITIKIKPAPKGGASGTGAVTITGGSADYNGAHGAFTFTGAESASSTVFVSHATGTVSY